MFRLEVLGPPRLVAEDGEVVLGAGMPLALLTYVALDGRSYSREHLATLFWPGTPRGRALQSVRQALLRIRNGSRHEVVEEADGRLHACPGYLTSDVGDFTAAVDERRIRDALALWRGAFLEGFRRPESWELEDWLDGQRSSLQRMLIAAVLQEGIALVEDFRADEGAELAQTALAAVGEEGALLRLAVEAHAAAGRRAAAEGVLTRLAALDAVEDMEELEDLVERIPPSPPLYSVPPSAPADASVDAPPSRIRWRPRWLGLAALATAAGVALVSLIVAQRGDAASGVVGAQGDNVLVYCDTRATDGVAAQLFRMDFDGANKHRLSDMESCMADYLPEAGILVARVLADDGSWRLAAFRPNPTNPITEWDPSEPEATAGLREPWFSHGTPSVARGRTLVFSAEDTTGNRDVYAWDAVDDRLLRLTTWEGVDQKPSVDALGDRVVFESYRTGAGDLYAIGLDGVGPAVRLTHGPLLEGRPRVRGGTVLFVRGEGTGEEDGDMELVLLDLGTLEETVLTHNDWNDFEPVWSPDGRRICWQSEELGHYESEVWVMDLARRQSWNVSRSPGRDSDCAWTPGGDGVVFLSARTGRGRIFIAPLTGGEATDLSRSEEYAEPVGIMPRPGAPAVPR